MFDSLQTFALGRLYLGLNIRGDRDASRSSPIIIIQITSLRSDMFLD